MTTVDEESLVEMPMTLINNNKCTYFYAKSIFCSEHDDFFDASTNLIA